MQRIFCLIWMCMGCYPLLSLHIYQEHNGLQRNMSPIAIFEFNKHNILCIFQFQSGYPYTYMGLYANFDSLFLRQ